LENQEGAHSRKNKNRKSAVSVIPTLHEVGFYYWCLAFAASFNALQSVFIPDLSGL